MVSRLIVLAGLALLLTGCETIAIQCPGWVQQTLPISPSRSDKLTGGTRNQILGANESFAEHCR